MRRTHSVLLGASVAAIAATAAAQSVRITEYMYSGSGGEFIELTNVGTAPVDLTGWSYDDDGRTPGAFSIGAFGVVAPGESVVITEDPVSVFRAAWGLSPSVKVIGDLGLPNGNGLGRNDALVLFDAKGAIVDQLVYGDQAFPGSIRTQGTAGWVVAGAVAQNNAYGWNLATVGDAQGSFQAGTGQAGNPGSFVVVGELPAGLPALVITEYMYGGGDEFIEFTNLSSEPVDVTGWSFDDNNFGTGYVPPFDISAFGTIAPGESVILTEASATVFRSNWNLAASVRIIGDYARGNGSNIGRNDEINIYDADGELVDRLTYGDQNFPGTPRTLNVSAWTAPENLGANDIFGWVFSAVGDATGAVVSALGDLGSPGSYLAIPSPCAGDLDGDGEVAGADLAILLGGWGKCPAKGECPGDLTGSGDVGGADLAVLLGNWGPCR